MKVFWWNTKKTLYFVRIERYEQEKKFEAIENGINLRPLTNGIKNLKMIETKIFII